MNKKYYTFLFLIFILIFLLYNIILHKYKEYKISEHIKIISNLNKQIEDNIKKASEIIEYKKSRAYRNKILKQDSGLKNKGEIVVYLVKEDKYNKFVKKQVKINTIEDLKKQEINSNTYNMTIYQKWMWFLFKKDLR